MVRAPTLVASGWGDFSEVFPGIPISAAIDPTIDEVFQIFRKVDRDLCLPEWKGRSEGRPPTVSWHGRKASARTSQPLSYVFPPDTINALSNYSDCLSSVGNGQPRGFAIPRTPRWAFSDGKTIAQARPAGH